jgi:sec-independent protein translocase protein TatA
MVMNFLFGIGTTELLLIVLVALLLFGGRKLPELMRGAGRGIREFKDAVNNVTDEEKKPADKQEQE